MSGGLTRRAFVWGGAAAAGLIGLKTIGCGRRATDPERVAAELRPLVGRGRAAWEVGAVVLDRARVPWDAGILAQRLAERLDWAKDGFGPGLAARLATAVREDFRRGDHVAVDGWRLAATEAYAAALMALVLPAPNAS
ncbi:MAG: hypothetical protein ACRD2Z_18405, partial [Thermoanaerobaculia bacterium]